MASPERVEQGHEQALQETAPIELSELERRVLAALENAKQPLDTIGVASAASLGVEETLAVLQGLREKGVVGEQPPEPIRKRFQVDEDVLARVAG
jgi:hypothetical protein